jgi:hypothetical protein
VGRKALPIAGLIPEGAASVKKKVPDTWYVGFGQKTLPGASAAKMG